MTFNFGLTPPPPGPEPTAAGIIRTAIDVIDRQLRQAAVPGRMFFSPTEVQDLLLDARNVLDTLTSPANLVAAAQEIASETKGKWEDMNWDAQ